MQFGVGLICYLLGSLAVAICLWAIPGPGGAASAAPPEHDRGHGGH